MCYGSIKFIAFDTAAPPDISALFFYYFFFFTTSCSIVHTLAYASTAWKRPQTFYIIFPEAAICGTMSCTDLETTFSFCKLFFYYKSFRMHRLRFLFDCLFVFFPVHDPKPTDDTVDPDSSFPHG